MSELTQSVLTEWVDGKSAQLEAFCFFARSSVFIHPSSASAHPSQHIFGTLSIIQQNSLFYITWSPNPNQQQQQQQPQHTTDASNPSENDEKDALILPTVNEEYAIKVDVNDVLSIRKHIPNIGYSYIIITLKSGVSFPPLFFHSGGVKQFLSMLGDFVELSKSATDPTLVLVNDVSNDLSRTRNELLLNSQSLSFSANMAHSILGGGAANDGGGSPSQDATGWVYLEPFSRIAQLTRDARAQLVPHPAHSNRQIRSEDSRLLEEYDRMRLRGEGATNATTTTVAPSPVTPMADGHSPATPSNRSRLGQVVLDAITPIAGGIRDLLQHETRQGSGIVQPERPFAKPPPLKELCPTERTAPLSIEHWFGAFDADGKMSAEDEAIIRRLIFQGGVDPEIRVAVWKYLLNYYPFSMSHAGRDKLRAAKCEEYFTIKRQWTSVSAAQERYFSKFTERRLRVDKDVVRTDRLESMYQEDDSPMLVKLREILLTYCFYNFDLGYVQGMSDLLSPILSVMSDEVDAFWCFAGYMETMRHNFHKDQHGMHQHLLNLRNLLQYLDPELFAYFREKDMLNMFVCFRWMLIDFKREFSYSDIMRLWEILWSGYPTPHFRLFVAIAILSARKETILREQMGFDEGLRFANSLSMTMDLDATLTRATELYNQLLCTPNLPDEVKHLV